MAISHTLDADRRKNGRHAERGTRTYFLLAKNYNSSGDKTLKRAMPTPVRQVVTLLKQCGMTRSLGHATLFDYLISDIFLTDLKLPALSL